MRPGCGLQFDSRMPVSRNRERVLDVSCFTLPPGEPDAVAAGEGDGKLKRDNDLLSRFVPRDPPGGRATWKVIGIGRALATAAKIVVVFFGLMITLLLNSAGAGENSADVSIESIRLGFNGKFKVGRWTPLVVSLKGGATTQTGQLEIVMPDGDGVPSRFVVPGVAIEPSESIEVATCVKFGRVRSGMTIEYVVDGCSIGGRHFSDDDLGAAVLTSQHLVINLGGDLRIGDAVKPLRSSDDERVVHTRLKDLAQLPLDWWAYDGVDQIVWATSQPEYTSGMSVERLQAISQWVHQGGRLVLCVGAQGELLLGEGQLARFCPGAFVRCARSRATTGLETFADAESMPEISNRVATAQRTSVLTDVRGVVDAFEESELPDRPVLIRTAYGFGQVVFVAVDLDQEPYANWSGQSKVVARLLGFGKDEDGVREERAGTSQASHEGYQDLGGQLRSALDMFSGVWRMPFSWIVATALLYIICIGPLDYLFTRRVLGRPELTWVTFPSLVGVFLVGVWWVAGRSVGHDIQVNQIDVVDVDISTEVVRGATWSHLYSPVSDSYDLDLRVGSPLFVAGKKAGVLLTWQGLPGKGLGGMNANVAGNQRLAAYNIMRVEPSVHSSVRLADVPIQIGASKSLSARWWARANSRDPGSLTADSLGLLRGEIRNPVDLPLENCMLVYDRWVYQLDSIIGRQTIKLTGNERPQNVDIWLRDAIAGGGEMKPWNPSSVDVPRIVELMLFHQAAGGRSYTRLSNRNQHFLDMSHLLQLKRAVLIGRSNAPASVLNRDDESLEAAYDRNWTIYRFVFPVQTASENQRD
jgi:hypothetical protein